LLKKKNRYSIAIAGAAGTVGRELVELLEEREFPFAELVLLDDEDSAGERLEVRGRNAVVRRLTKDAFAGADIAFFFAGASHSREFAAAAVAAGAVVVDGTSAFRLLPQVPLVAAEVNPQAVGNHAGIIAAPDSPVIALATILKPLHDHAVVRRVVVTTLQSVSGTGKKAIDELAGQTVALLNFRDVETKTYPHQIAFNCIPQVDAFAESGATEAEANMRGEMRKVLADDSLQMTATAVRVPVFRGDAASVNIETAKHLPPNEARSLLSRTPGVVVYDDPVRHVYPLQVEAPGKDEVSVGRVRTDASIANGLNLWAVWDNVRKGAALNAVQIAEELIKQ
jgi:aspartate-semialdehyde dehydrogenase